MKFPRLFFPILFISAQLFGQNFFNKGVNLSNWLQAGSPTEIQFTRYTKQDFENIKSLGADVIRLPLNLHGMTDGAPDYNLDPLFLKFLDSAVDWAEELDINILLDNHTFNPAVNTDPSIEQALIPVWQNMAGHFKKRSTLVYYEILNEPHGIADNVWNAIQGRVIDAIREIDTIHTIIVGPAGWNSYNNLDKMPVYEDDNLLYTFHFYDPFIFTHQGASWSDPSLVPLAGVPFPYDADRMPEVPDELKGTYIEGSMSNYVNEGKISHVREMLGIAVNFKETRNVPLFCGEFGVYDINSDNTDRVLWYSVVRSYLELKGIAWTSWDYHGGFGLFEKGGQGLFDHDLNTGLLKALGFNVPPQTEFEARPDSAGFGMYLDFIEKGMLKTGNNAGELNFYSEDAAEGDYGIYWKNPLQYDAIGFEFSPVKDISYLVENGFNLGFWVKSDNPSAQFQVRFLDTDEGPEDHPWRMGTDISNATAGFDGTWKYVKIPLSSMHEYGAWENEWFEEQGEFDWKKVQRFEIVDEFGVLNNTEIYFDEIKIYDPFTNVDDSEIVSEFRLYRNYPNPFNPSTNISFELPESGDVRLSVYNILGEKVAALIDGQMEAGRHIEQFYAGDLPSGIYICEITAGRYRGEQKMMLIK